MCTVSSEEKLKYLEEHFLYELDMLLFSITKLIEYNKLKEIKSSYITLEAFLFHARNLYEFFYYGKKRSTDARAYDFYYENVKWPSLRPKKSGLLKSMKTRADKELAHLTYKRIYGTPPEKQWQCGEIAKSLCEITKVFLNNLPKKYSSDNVTNMRSQLDRIKIV